MTELPDPPAQTDAPESQPDEDQPVGPVPMRGPLSDDPEVPEADALDQAEEVSPGPRRGEPTSDPEVPEADAWDQSLEVPFDDPP